MSPIDHDHLVHIALANETTGDEQQLVGVAGCHAHGPAALGGVDEHLGGPAPDVTAEDVALQEIAGVGGGAAARGDALGRAGSGRNDDLSRWYGGGRRGQGGHQDHQQQGRDQPADPGGWRAVLGDLPDAAYQQLVELDLAKFSWSGAPTTATSAAGALSLTRSGAPGDLKRPFVLGRSDGLWCRQCPYFAYGNGPYRN
jgi:hypothetical protein